MNETISLPEVLQRKSALDGGSPRVFSEQSGSLQQGQFTAGSAFPLRGLTNGHGVVLAGGAEGQG